MNFALTIHVVEPINKEPKPNIASASPYYKCMHGKGVRYLETEKYKRINMLLVESTRRIRNRKW